MSAPAVRPHLYGRAAELAAIDALLEGARESRSGCLVVRGEAGMGKSALLAAARERAAGMTVLQAVGVESESELAFATLHQLTAPLLGRLDDIPGPQASALAGALGIAASTGHDRFLIGAAVLSLLAAAAEQQPVLCLVDDAHWTDDPSSDALTFAARRLHSEGVVLLFAAREGEARRFEAPGLPDTELTGLDADAAAELMQESGARSLSGDVRNRLVESTGGNPLALIELPQALSESQLAGEAPLVEPLPVTARVENAFLERVRRLPPDTQQLLLVAAIDDTGDPGIVLPGAAALGVEESALEPADEAHLIHVVDGRLRFSHPLVRSAIHQAATFAQRGRVHDALVGVLEGDAYADRRAWHRAAATLGTDDEVAAALAASADRARQRRGFGAAAAALARAAELTSDEQVKAARLAAAAQAAWLAGQPARAAALATSARAINIDPIVRANIDYLRGTMELQLGRALDAHKILFDAAAAVAPVDPTRAIEMFVSASEAAGFAGNNSGEAEECNAMIERLYKEHGAEEFEITMTSGVSRMIAGAFGPAAELLRAARELAPTSANPRRETWAGGAAIIMGDVDGARLHYGRAADQARAQGALPTLAWMLALLASAELYGRLISRASASSEEGLRLARDTGQVNCAAYHLANLAGVASVRGREDECRSRAAEALAIARTNGLGIQAHITTRGLAELELSLGRGDEAYTHFDVFYGGETARANQAVRNLSSATYIESAARSGHTDVARAEVAHFRRWARDVGSNPALAQAERCYALLASDADAVAHFEEALRLHALADVPFDRARTELAYGEVLRRARARREAREHLRTALAVFEQVGATLWAERARTELRASGETARRRDPSTMDKLTPQELQIARFVATGSTNKEVAAQLFLSPRTIDFHLRNVFSKLGIRSRNELHRFAFDGEPAMSAVPAAT